jgi:hypothetical protein
MNLKTISATSGAKLQQLYGATGLLSRLTGSVGDQVNILHELGASGEPAVLIEILPWTLNRNRDIRRAAGDAVQALLELVSSHRLAELDQRVREIGAQRTCWDEAWQGMSIEDVSFMADCDEPRARALLGITSFHPNGRIREAATRAFGRFTSGRELPFLLLRLNDWVQSIRRHAASLVRERLTEAYASQFIANLPLVVRLEACGRMDDVSLRSELGTFLRSAACRAALLDGLRSAQRSTRRLCFRIAADATGSGSSTILQVALADIDPTIRLAAARRLLPTLAVDDLRQVLNGLICDPFAPIRALALQLWAERIPAEAGVTVRRSLFDRSASVRETARYFLRQQGLADVAEIYRSNLVGANGSTRPHAIAGLGETGGESDAATVRPFVEIGNSVSLRKAALGALGRLAPKSERDMFFRALADDHPGVSRLAAQVLAGKDCRADRDRVLDLATNDRRHWVRNHAVRLVSRLAKWDRLPILLACLIDSDERIAGVAAEGVRRWWITYNRTFVDPTREQLESAAHLLQERSSRLPPGLRNDLQSLLAEKQRQ